MTANYERGIVDVLALLRRLAIRVLSTIVAFEVKGVRLVDSERTPPTSFKSFPRLLL